MAPVASELQYSDIDRAIAQSGACELFADALASIDSDEALLLCLARYIHLNAVFGSGVAGLAGAIGVRTDLFRDRAEPLAIVADRSAEVAAAIFFAAIDEFGGTSARCPTHRAMAQELLRAAAAHAGCPAPLPDSVAGDGGFSAAVREGYGIGRALNDPELFGAIGFHLGSERLADQEFHLLDRFLRSRYGDLVRHLEQTRTANGHPAYLWIGLHTTVEADHFDTALRGANGALEFYAGPASRETIRGLILEGAGRFAALLAGFMRSLRP